MNSTYIELPTELRKPEFRFIKLGASGKKLKAPIETGWNIFDIDELKVYIEKKAALWDADKSSGKHAEVKAKGKNVTKRPEFRGRLNNYSYDDPEFQKWLRDGKNYGVTAAGGLIKLESDDVARWKALGIIALLPETFAVQSSTENRQHFYFFGPKVADSPLCDPETGKDTGHIRGTGEDGGRGGMVVGPGSVHPSGARYVVIKDLPIANIKQEILEKIKAQLSKPNSEKKADSKNDVAEDAQSRVTESTHIDPFQNVTCTQVLGPGWDWHLEGLQKAGPNPYGNHTNNTGHNLVVKENDKEFFCFACNQGGGVSRLIAIRAGIMQCSQSGSPTGQAWWDTIRYARDEGLIDETTAKASGLRDEVNLDEMKEQIETDPQIIDDRILEILANLQSTTPLRYSQFIADIKLKREIKTALKKAVTAHQHKEKNIVRCLAKTIFPEEIRNKARAIAERGDPVKFLIYQAQRNHLGDINYQKVLLCSIVSSSSLTSKGIQPGSTGDRGSGKTDACDAAYILVPPDRKLDGSLSPMSLFYMEREKLLKAGMIFYSDDVEYEPILPIYKRSAGSFQKGTKHRTVSKDRTLMELVLPPRLVWWLTSVESVSNEQAFDRQYPISTDSTPDHKKRVSKELGSRRARKELKLVEDEGILVSQALFQDIFESGPFKVFIPQARNAEWTIVADFRGQERFWDLVDAFAILRWRQRKRDGDGWIIADDQDIIDAKSLFLVHKVTHATDLTESELKLVGVLMSGVTMTQKSLVEATGLSQSTVSERLTSIMAKSPLVTCDYAQGQKLYSINNTIDHKSKYWEKVELIRIETDSEKVYRAPSISLSGCYRYVIGLPIGTKINNINRLPSSLSANLNSCSECNLEACLGVGWGIKNSDSLNINPQFEPGNEPISKENQHEGAEIGADKTTDKAGDSIPKQQQQKQISTESELLSGPHPRKDLPTPGRKIERQEEGATCPICGRDIGPGHSIRTYEGVSYCTSCPPHLSLLCLSVRELTKKNGIAPTAIEIYEDVASRDGRPPRKELVSAMLRASGFAEKDGRWVMISDAPAERADA